MANKKYIIGSLVFLVALTYVYVTFMGELRIDVTSAQTTFKIWNDTTNKFDITGIETSKLLNGTKTITRQSSIIEFRNNTNTANIKRTANFGIPQIIDSYFFDGDSKDKENFPVAHTVEVLNASGLIYQYDVSGLFYDGATKTISSDQTSMTFGKNMKVTWDSGFYYAKVTKLTGGKGKLTIKYKIKSDYETFNLRLFDPISEYNTYCYQETATTSTSCGGLSGGSYVIEPDGFYSVDAVYSYDGDWDSWGCWGSGVKDGWVNVTYQKPILSQNTGTLWQLGYAESGTLNLLKTNVSIPATCWNYNTTHLKLSMASVGGGAWYYECFNGTWQNLYTLPNCRFHEEAMWWNVTCGNYTPVVLLNGSSSDRYYELGSYANISTIYQDNCGHVLSTPENVWLDINITGYGINYTNSSTGIINYDFKTFAMTDLLHDNTTNTNNQSYTYQASAGRTTKTFGWNLNNRDEISSINFNISSVSTLNSIADIADSVSCTGDFDTTYTCSNTTDNNWNTWGQPKSTVGSVANVIETYIIPKWSLGKPINITAKLGSTGGVGGEATVYCYNSSSAWNPLIVELYNYGVNDTANVPLACQVNGNVQIKTTLRKNGFGLGYLWETRLIYTGLPRNIMIDTNQDGIDKYYPLAFLENVSKNRFYLNRISTDDENYNLSFQRAGTSTVYLPFPTDSKTIREVSFNLTGYPFTVSQQNIITTNATHNFTTRTVSNNIWIIDFNTTNIIHAGSKLDFPHNITSEGGNVHPVKIYNITASATSSSPILVYGQKWGGNSSLRQNPLNSSEIEWTPSMELGNNQVYRIVMGKNVTWNNETINSKIINVTIESSVPSAYLIVNYTGVDEILESETSASYTTYQESCGGSSGWSVGNPAYAYDENYTTYATVTGGDPYCVGVLDLIEKNVVNHVGSIYNIKMDLYAMGGTPSGQCYPRMYQYLYYYDGASYVNTLTDVSGALTYLSGATYTSNTDTTDGRYYYDYGNNTGEILQRYKFGSVFSHTCWLNETKLTLTRNPYYPKLYIGNSNVWSYTGALRTEQTVNIGTYLLNSGSNLFNFTNTGEYGEMRIYFDPFWSGSPSNVKVKIGSSNTNIYSNTTIFNTSEKITLSSTTDIDNYISSNTCKNSKSCNVPVRITTSSAGIIGIGNINVTYDYPYIELNKSAITTGTPNIDLTFYDGNITIQDLNVTYKGSKNISVTAHSDDYSLNDTQNIQVVWSNMSLTKPYSWTDDLLIYPDTNSSINVEPYSQTSTIPIWNFTSQFYHDQNVNISVKLDQALNSCINVTANTVYNSSNATLISTSENEIISNLGNIGSSGVWLFFNLNNCPSTSLYIQPNMTIYPYCSSCVW